MKLASAPLLFLLFLLHSHMPESPHQSTPKKKVSPQRSRGGLYQRPIRRQGSAIGSRELTSSFDAESTLNIPRQEKGGVRILYFGGVGEIGKNMYAIEYEDDIVVLDCGMKFAEADTPGIDFLVPNIQYLEERKEKIRGLVISHAHLDHIGGISVLIDKMGNPPIFSRRLSIELIKNRHAEFESKESLVFREVEQQSMITLSETMSLNFFSVTHTIPDSMGIIINTPVGAIVFTGDLKLTHLDGVVDASEEKEFAQFKSKNVLLTMADSTNADRAGFSLPESKVVETMSKIIANTKGRIILSSFSSQIERTLCVIEQAIANGRKVVVQGRSMITNLTIASDLGLLKVPLRVIIPVEKIDDYPKDKILVLATGAQGDTFSALDRMSRKAHRYIQLGTEDTIVFSSSVIPGNEEPVQNLKDRLSRLGVNMITYQTSDVHSSGHANRGELKWIHEHIGARFFLPLHGYHYMCSAHAQILHEIGMPKTHTALPDNGSIIDISADGSTMTKQTYTMPTTLTVVDGNAVGTVQNVVLSDRISLKEQGILVLVLLVNQQTGKVRKSPDIISRGFIYLKESRPLIEKVRTVARKVAERHIKHSGIINVDGIKQAVTKEVQNCLYMETRKRPIVMSVVYIK